MPVYSFFIQFQLCIFQLKSNTITLKVGLETIKLNLNDILFVKSDDIYIEIQTKTKKYTIRKSLDSFLKEINHSIFIKVHRSYIINKTKITSKKATSIFIDNFEIPISRSLNLEL